MSGTSKSIRSCPLLLHVFPSFRYGGVPIRIADVLNRLEKPYQHMICSLDENSEALSRINSTVRLDTLAAPRSRVPQKFIEIDRIIRRIEPDLLLTYNWGAMDWALANTLSTRCNHLHFESGFGPDEADAPKRTRSFYRRYALRGAQTLVVPAQSLAALASRERWIRAGKVRVIPNGVDTNVFSPGSAGKTETIRLGTICPLRDEKRVDVLIDAFRLFLAENSTAELIVFGDGPRRHDAQGQATSYGIEDKVSFRGHVDDVGTSLRELDIFVLTSDTEQLPNTLLQAMATGLPVVATDVGDVSRTLPAESRPFVVARGDVGALADRVAYIARDSDLRIQLGRANRARVCERYGISGMVQTYDELYESALNSRVSK